MRRSVQARGKTRYDARAMRVPAFFVCLAACGGAGSTRPAARPAVAAVDPRGPHQAAVAAQVQPLVEAELIAGVVVGLYDAGAREVYGFGAGPGGGPPTGRTRFEIGAVTEVFTGLLLADAVQRKEVELDQPVAELLPPGVTAPTRDGAVVTLRRLATHSAGLPRLPPSLAPRATAADPYAGYGEEQLYADLVATRLDSAPGTRVAYSNYGAGLLGFTLGRKLGAGYQRAVEQRVLQPLGLTDTTFGPDKDAPRAQGTDRELVAVPPWTWGALAGAGALSSSVRDLLALVDAQLDAAAGGKLPLRRAMALTQEPQLAVTGDNLGIGWQIDAEGRYWHGGQTGGHHAFVGFDPKTRRGVVVLASTATDVVDALARRMFRILAREPIEPPKLPSPAQLASYAGRYALEGVVLTVSVTGKRIYVEGPGEPRLRMIPVATDAFYVEPIQTVVRFESEGGAVSRAVFVVGERQLAAPRVP